MLQSGLTSIQPTSKLNLPSDQVQAIIKLTYSGYMARRGVKQEPSTKSVEAIECITRWLTSNTAKPSLLISGTIGSGKTTLAKALCSGISKICERYESYLNENGWAMDPKDLKKMRSDVYSIPSTHYIPAMQVNEMVKNPDQFMTIKRMAGILVIDDLGTEETTIKDYGTVRLPMIELINWRYDYNLPIVITTNLDNAGIAERYGERIMDRINEMCNYISCVGESYRIKK